MRALLMLAMLISITSHAQLITRVQLVPLSNYVDAVQASLSFSSNYLYSQISAGGITAAEGTNIANAVSAITSNGVVAFTMTTSNTLVALVSSSDTLTSNGAVAFTMTASNNLNSLIVANDNITSNALRLLTVDLQGATNGLNSRVGNLEGGTNGLNSGLNGIISRALTNTDIRSITLNTNLDVIGSNRVRWLRLDGGQAASSYLGLDGDSNVVSLQLTSAIPTQIQLNAASNVLRTDISNLQGATNGLRSDVLNLQGGTNGLRTDVLNLQGATNGLFTSITFSSNALRTDISNLQGATNGLNSRAGNLDGATNGLHTRVGNLEGATNGLRADVLNLQAATNNIDDDLVNFDDADSLWTATKIGPALEEMNESINAGIPNGTGAKVHWSQLLGVPVGFSDGTDDGGGAGGGWSAYDAPATNATFWSSDTNRTNLVIAQRIGQLVPMLSVRGSNNAPILEIDHRGFLILTNALTNYNRGNTIGTPANTIAIGVEDFGGFAVPAWFKDSKLGWAMNPARWNSRTYTLFPSAGTTVGSDGVTTANAGGTVVAHTTPDEILPYMVSVSSAATSNSVGGVSMTVNLASAGAHNGSSKAAGYFFHTEWCSTNIIGQVVGGGAPRYFVGLANAATPNLTNIVNTTNATGQYIGLMVDTRQSLDMFITCRDGSAEFRTNTGINFKATNIFHLSLYNSPTNRFVGWKVKDLTDRLEATGTFSNNVPTNFMKGTILAKNGTNRNNAIFFSKMYLQSPLTPQ